MPRIAAQNHFTFLRSHALSRTTAIEREIASRIARTIDNPLVGMQINKESKSFRNLIIHYTHEERLQTRKKHIHQLWNQIFANTPVTDTKLIVGNHNSRNATKVLIRRQLQIILSRKTTDNINLE